KCSQIITRFPPEPNGFLHLGHARAIIINFELAHFFEGKTHAYLLPILSKIDFQKPFTQAIILVPTNDLVFQVWEIFKQIEKTNFTKILYGGMDKQKAIATFEKKQPPLIIATPD
ncbi:DEAD/DEAH box helicase, partial [Candidatus Phytoplasma asteris]|uniref:DEAD/DEAH box helicase n=1 Tax=Candidatus Phytoplasma asteris TaxID=85620 RepID=UPI0039E127E6